MTRSALVVALLVACGCGKKSDAPAPSGSASAAGDILLAAMHDYSDKMVPIVVGFAGDCDATAKQLLVLEPLAQTIRTQGEALDADPPAREAFRERMSGAKDSALARIDAQLKALGSTREDMNRKEAEAKKTCANNAAFTDAEQRVGLRKKKS